MEYTGTPSFTEKHGDLSVTSDDGNDYDSESAVATNLLEKEEGLVMHQLGDIEAQQPMNNLTSGRHGAEYSVPLRTKFTYLGLYFSLNLGLTLFNKAILDKFAFPWLLTFIHTSFATLGCLFLLWWGHFEITTLNTRENISLLTFSVLYTVNIAISNVSLQVVSVSFHQIMRSTSPLFTILIYRVWYSRSYGTATYLSLVPIVIGAALATYGDYYFTLIGFSLTLLGVMLAALKTVATNRLMTGNLQLPALELLFRMSPLAAIQSLMFAVLSGELGAFLDWVAQGHLTSSCSFALAGNGLLACFLSVASLHTNKIAGALTISICANLKQCLTVLLGIIVFDTKFGIVSGCGMLIALVGAALYSKAELLTPISDAPRGERQAEEPLSPLRSKNMVPPAQ